MALGDASASFEGKTVVIVKGKQTNDAVGGVPAAVLVGALVVVAAIVLSLAASAAASTLTDQVDLRLQPAASVSFSPETGGGVSDVAYALEGDPSAADAGAIDGVLVQGDHPAVVGTGEVDRDLAESAPLPTGAGLALVGLTCTALVRRRR